MVTMSVINLQIIDSSLAFARLTSQIFSQLKIYANPIPLNYS